MYRQRTDELREALAASREHLGEEAARPRRTAARDLPPETAVREPILKQEVAASAPVPRSAAGGELFAALSSGQALRRAILLHEVLGPPKALERSDGTGR